MKQSFQAGVDTLYNKCVSCGSTPSSKTPTAVSDAIQGIYGNRYTEGYNNGRTQGQNDVKNNPNNYGLYNKTQYDQNYNNGYNSGYSAGQSSAAINTLLYCHGYNTSRISNGDPIPFDMSAYSGVILICIACIWAYGVSLNEDTINLSPTPVTWVHKPTSENDHTGIGGSWGYCATLVAKYNLDSVSNKTVYLTHGSNGQMRGCGWFVFRSI